MESLNKELKRVEHDNRNHSEVINSEVNAIKGKYIRISQLEAIPLHCRHVNQMTQKTPRFGRN
jgi:hypothetical protein